MGARRRSATQRTAKGVREGQGEVVSEEEGGRGREKGKGVRSWAFSAGGRRPAAGQSLAAGGLTTLLYNTNIIIY